MGNVGILSPRVTCASPKGEGLAQFPLTMPGMEVWMFGGRYWYLCTRWIYIASPSLLPLNNTLSGVGEEEGEQGGNQGQPSSPSLIPS